MVAGGEYTRTMFRFNDELLLTDSDRALAARLYPSVMFALDHPSLRKDFLRIDQVAIRAKKRSRLIGLLTLCFAVVSLLGFPLENVIAALWPDMSQPAVIFRWLAIIGAACGVLAIVFGNAGFLFGKSKRDWLEKRLMSERLRQWHAQYLIAHALDVARAAGDAAREAAYATLRETAYQQFQRTFLDQITSEYTKYTLRTAAGHSGRKMKAIADSSAYWIDPDWNARATRKLTPAEDAIVSDLLEAYTQTRLQGQVQYTNYILSSEGKFWSLPSLQVTLLDNTAFTLVIGAFASNFVALVSAISTQVPLAQSVLGSLAIIFAILAVGVRALQEGLRPHQEIRRMEYYASAIDHARESMLEARTTRKKLEAAMLLERASFEEMLEFLGTNEQARFVL